MFTAVVSKPRRSADRGSPGDAPPVGDCGHRGRAGQETVPAPAWRRQPKVAEMGQSDPLARTPHGQGSVRRRRFGVDPPGLGTVGDECSFLAWDLRPPGSNMPPHPGFGCKDPERILEGARAIKPWKTSSAANETRSARPCSRPDPQWSGYGPILPQRGLSAATKLEDWIDYAI